jgi:NADPH-dependent 2,4-dienoyl-CoA reductase/sulfur reductase-like enzyme/rhodanese-related sulfurtransferase
MAKKLVVIGGVAGGATAAARARRLSEDAEITVIERGPYVSFANCGLPYHVSGEIPKRGKLILQTPEGFDARYRVKVLTRTAALEIDRAGKRVRVEGPEGQSWIGYDALILAQGGNPFKPGMPGADSERSFTLWNIPDMDRMLSFMKERNPESALVVGGGFIGLEMAEAFAKRGLRTTVVELTERVMPAMDREFGSMVGGVLEANGVRVLTGVGVAAYRPDERKAELSDGRLVDADMVLFSIGVKPELELAKSAGLAIGPTGGLVVDERLATSDPSIYAAGDMCEVTHKVSGRKARIPLAGPANRQGRIAASNALGLSMRYSGALGTSVFKAFDHAAASTGLTEKAAREAGFDVGVAIVAKDQHVSYYPGASELVFKLVYDRGSRRVLGAQAFGRSDVEKRIDVIAVALQGKLAIDDLAELDLAYAPPFSAPNDPVNLAAYAAINDLSGLTRLETASALKAATERGNAYLLDVRNRVEFDAAKLPGSVNVPLDELRDSLDSIPSDRPIHVIDRTGYRGHIAARLLAGNGRPDAVNVTGGFIAIEHEGSFEIERE